MEKVRIFDRRQLLLMLWVLLTAGFVATSLIGYQVSKRAIRDTIIGQDLPLTSSNIYSEIQKDLVRPVLISMTMAHDTFLRDWVMAGERDVAAITRYLKEVRERHGAFSSFFVSERSGQYYTGDSILKRVSALEPRDFWYYRVRDMSADYEINVDPDLANKDALTIFINYRVYDYEGRYIGATGIGLTVDAVQRLVEQYQERYRRTIYFVDQGGHLVEFAGRQNRPRDLREWPGLGPLLPQILKEQRGSWQYEAAGDNHILHVNYLPELKWYLFVEQNESVALAAIRQSLYINITISVAVTLIVVFLIHLTLLRYQQRIEEMASTDKLTGLLNRHAFNILIERLRAEHRREPRPACLLLADIDHFKAINDHYGHLAGDDVLVEVAQRLQGGLRASDLAVRWGGEEFLMVLRGCDLIEAQRLAEALRQKMAGSPVATNSHSIDVTLSIGVCRFDANVAPEGILAQVDAALYRAKQAGRNRVETA